MQKKIPSEVRMAAAYLNAAVARGSLNGLSEREYGHNFAGVLGEKIIHGTFDNAGWFKAGDVIKAVVSRRQGVLYVHAMLRCKDHLLCIDSQTWRGVAALRRCCMRWAWRWGVVGWVPAGLMAIFLLQHDGALTLANWLAWLPAMIVGPPILAACERANAYREQLTEARHATTIFRILGFPRPDDVDLWDAWRIWPERYGSFSGIDFALALRRNEEDVDKGAREGYRILKKGFDCLALRWKKTPAGQGNRPVD